VPWFGTLKPGVWVANCEPSNQIEFLPDAAASMFKEIRQLVFREIGKPPSFSEGEL
jgi:hypothetical protein